jgi:hypothetical protein
MLHGDDKAADPLGGKRAKFYMWWLKSSNGITYKSLVSLCFSFPINKTVGLEQNMVKSCCGHGLPYPLHTLMDHDSPSYPSQPRPLGDHYQWRWDSLIMTPTTHSSSRIFVRLHLALTSCDSNLSSPSCSAAQWHVLPPTQP